MKKLWVFILLLGLCLPGLLHAGKIIRKGEGPFYKLPYRPRWVSVVKKGKIFRYKRKEFSSPQVYKDWIFVGSGAQTFYAMENKRGWKKWRFQTEGAVSSKPAFLDPYVFFGDEKGIVYAVTIQDGREKWRASLGSEVLVAPTVAEGKLYIATLEGRLAALNVDDGKILWSVEHSLPRGMTIRAHTPPLLHNQLLYMGYADGTLGVHSALTGQWLREYQIAGASERFTDVDTTPLIDGDRLYAASFEGDLTCLSLKNGQTLWKKEIGSGVDFLLEGNTLFVSSSDRHVYALDKINGTELWKYQLETGMPSKPVLWKNVLVVGSTHNKAVFLNAKNGDLMSRRYAKKGIFGDPVLDDNKLYYLSNGGRLYALRMVWSP